MKKPFTKNTLLNIGYYSGLALKGINALIEFIGGLLLIIINNNRLNRIIDLVALPELREDPTNHLLNYLVTLGQSLSINSQLSIAIYMLLHGITKLAVVWLLWYKKIWAYPLAIVVFALFIAFETYSYAHSRSILMLLIVLIDAAITGMVVLEYKSLKKGKSSNPLL